MNSEKENLTKLCKDLGITEAEAKARFFALYFGQIILRRPFVDFPFTCYPNAGDPDIKRQYLELTHPSDISDELAIKCAEVELPFPSKIDTSPERGRRWVLEYIDEEILSTYLSDLLRSHGVALPWINLSIEDLITLGWVRIRK